MATKSDKIWYAIKHNPELIGELIKDTSIPNGMIYSLLKKSINCRIGIEFELSGSFIYNYYKENYSNNKLDYSKLVSKIKSKYRLTDYNEDHSDLSKDACKDTLNEIRISISDFHQLKGLYHFCNDLGKYCDLISTGGIHIHIDFSDYLNNIFGSKLVKKVLSKKLDEIESIFPKYLGTYNKRKIGIKEKATYVNISRLDTLEFRIAPLTFNYSDIIDWIIKLMKFRSKLIRELRSYKIKDPVSLTKYEPTELNRFVDLNYLSASEYITLNRSTWSFY